MLSPTTYPREIDDGFVALEVLVEPEDLDAVIERWVPADVGTVHMEATVDREVLARAAG